MAEVAGREVDEALAQARGALERIGLLLFSDPALPSLVGLIVGEPLRQSWWGHPRGGLIYRAMNALDDDQAVLSTKLVAGKVTYVHERLWPAIYTLGTAHDDWQLDGLSPGATWLLHQVEADGDLRTDQVFVPHAVMARTRVADAARELERRLLVHATEVHTESGAHAKVLETWPRWAADATTTMPPMTAEQARAHLEEAANRLAAETVDGVAQLPWQPRTRRMRSN
jgi:hypothetical protein